MDFNAICYGEVVCLSEEIPEAAVGDSVVLYEPGESMSMLGSVTKISGGLVHFMCDLESFRRDAPEREIPKD